MGQEYILRTQAFCESSKHQKLMLSICLLDHEKILESGVHTVSRTYIQLLLLLLLLMLLLLSSSLWLLLLLLLKRKAGINASDNAI